MSLDYDIIIAGAGITGSTLARALAPSGLRLALIDPAPDAFKTAPASALNRQRFSAIYGGQINALQRLDSWPETDDRSGQEFQRMHIWESQNRAAIAFDSTTLGQTRLGAVIGNEQLVSALHSSIDSTRATKINRGISAISWPSPGAVSVVLDNGEQLSTRLLVAADGTNSNIRQQSRIDIDRRDYHQHAVVATVKPARHHNQTAWQKFLPSGPVAFLPLADGYCSIVWSTDSEHATALVSQSDEQFCEQLGDAINGQLGVIKESSMRFKFPLFRQQARRYCADRIALIGDAAHRIHPLAGMGANLGITDALALAELINSHSSDPGNSALLANYDRWRRSGVNSYLAAQELLSSCYRWSAGSALRGLGVSLLNRSVLVKPELLRQTIGLTGNLPQLMKLR